MPAVVGSARTRTMTLLANSGGLHECRPPGAVLGKGDPTMELHKASDEPHVNAEALVRAVATRHGFRSRDYALIWDQGTFDGTRSVHELAITTRDGRRASVQIEAEALGKRNPWPFFPRIEDALSQLGRRSSDRGADPES